MFASPRHLNSGLILVILLLIPSTSGRHDGGDLVNAVLGNATLATPVSGSDETTRIRVHLEGVAQHLASADVSYLSPELWQARSQNIDRLRKYARTGRFPHKPSSVPGRTPNFVDDRGVVCAVGYLLEQDCGHAAAVEIAREYRLDYVPYIDSPVLVAWQATSGLTMLELAMIQPMYGGDPPREDEYLSDHETVALVLLAGDLVTSVINLTFVADGGGNATTGLIGFMMGAGSVGFGIVEDHDTALVAGIVTGLLGSVSFAMAPNESPEQQPVVSAQPFFGRLTGARNVGMMASVRF